LHGKITVCAFERWIVEVLDLKTINEREISWGIQPTLDHPNRMPETKLPLLCFAVNSTFFEVTIRMPHRFLTVIDTPIHLRTLPSDLTNKLCDASEGGVRIARGYTETDVVSECTTLATTAQAGGLLGSCRANVRPEHWNRIHG